MKSLNERETQPETASPRTPEEEALERIYLGEAGSNESISDYQTLKAALEENKALKAQLAEKEALLDRERLRKILDELHGDLNFCYDSKQANRIYDKTIAAIKEGEDK